MKVFLISDTHFYHERAILKTNRPFRNVEEMNEKLIANWNNVVGDNDKVFHLGDVFFYPSQVKMKPILSRLKGYKVLIKGNHDRESDSKYLRAGFQEVHKEYVLNGYLLTHQPMEEEEIRQRQQKEGIIKNICGHVHDWLHILKDYHICVSVEVINYTPILLEDVIKYADKLSVNGTGLGR